MATPTPRARWPRLVLLVALLAGAVLVARALGFERYTDPATLAATVRALRGRPGIAVGFVAAYALGATVGLPATPFTLAGGALFGTVLGSAANWLGALLGATGSWALARWLGHGAIGDWLRRRVPRLDALARARGFSTMFRLRLIPVMPFNALNVGAGLAGVPFGAYVTGTALGILPGTIVYTSFADALLAGAAGARREALVRVAIAGALLIALSFLPALLRRLGVRPPAAGETARAPESVRDSGARGA